MRPIAFGKYTLLCRIARGGMADLFLARSSGVGGVERMVAVKLVASAFARDKSSLAMFQDEARIASTIDHPNIGQVLEVGKLSDQYYLVMEYLHGQDLRSIARATQSRGEGRVPPEVVVYVGAKICSALQYAHEAHGLDGRPLNIIHRDVSPSNIMVTYRGNVKLVDFGIAKAANRSARTEPGCIKGKLRYLSPEQLLGLPVDHRTDIFTLGVSLWEASVGRQLFEGLREFEVFEAIGSGRVPAPSSLVSGYPAGLERVVLKALAHKAEDRYQTAQQMHVDLADYARDAGITLSELRIAEFMRETFRDEISAWEDAQRRGVSLIDHIIETACASEFGTERVLDSADDLATIVPSAPTDSDLDLAANASQSDAATPQDGSLPPTIVPEAQATDASEGPRKTILYGMDVPGGAAQYQASESSRKTVLYEQAFPATATAPGRAHRAATPNHGQTPPIRISSSRRVAVTPDGVAKLVDPTPSGAEPLTDASRATIISAQHPTTMPDSALPPSVEQGTPTLDPEQAGVKIASNNKKRTRTGDWAHQATSIGPRPGTHPYFRQRKPSVLGEVPTAADSNLHKRRIRMIVVAVAVALVGMLVGVLVFNRRQGPAKVRSTSAATPERPPTAASAQSAGQTRAVHITSDPTGAMVFSAMTGQELGTTPLDLPVGVPETAKLEFQLEGHDVTSVRIQPTDRHRHVVLRAQHRPEDR